MGWRVGLNWNVGGRAGVGGGFIGARTMIEAPHAEHKVRCHMAFHNWGWYGIAAPGDRIRVEFRVQERLAALVWTAEAAVPTKAVDRSTQGQVRFQRASLSTLSR